MNIRKILFTVLIVYFGLTSSIAQAIDMFLDFPDSDIVGESDDRTHQGEIEILAWSWVLTPENGKSVAVRDLSFTKFVDSATPSFFMKAVMGENLGRAVFTVRRQVTENDRGGEFLIITMHDATISSVSSSGNEGEDRMAEQVNLSFSSISGEYISPTKSDGTGRVTYTFDIARNKN